MNRPKCEPQGRGEAPGNWNNAKKSKTDQDARWVVKTTAHALSTKTTSTQTKSTVLSAASCMEIAKNEIACRQRLMRASSPAGKI